MEPGCLLWVVCWFYWSSLWVLPLSPVPTSTVHLLDLSAASSSDAHGEVSVSPRHYTYSASFDSICLQIPFSCVVSSYSACWRGCWLLPCSASASLNRLCLSACHTLWLLKALVLGLGVYCLKSSSASHPPLFGGLCLHTLLACQLTPAMMVVGCVWVTCLLYTASSFLGCFSLHTNFIFELHLALVLMCFVLVLA